MFENVKELFLKYCELKIPFIISAFTTDGRRVMFVMIGFKGTEIIGISRDTRIPGHFNPDTIIEWRDYSNENSNAITKQEAKDIYEKYIGIENNSKASDGSQRSEAGETNGTVEEHGTAVQAI